MALDFAMEHGGLTIQDLESLCPDTNRRSLQRDLRAMLQKGVLVEQATSTTDPTKRYGFHRNSVAESYDKL